MRNSVNSVTASVGWNWQEAGAESNGVDSLTPLLSKQLILLQPLYHSRFKKEKNGGGLSSLPSNGQEHKFALSVGK